MIKDYDLEQLNERTKKILKVRKNQRPSYYTIIPSQVRYDKDLKDKEKLLYGEILALTQKNGFCHASNNFLGSLINLSKARVSKSISRMEEMGFLKILRIWKNKRIVYRLIKPCLFRKDRIPRSLKIVKLWENDK